MTLRGPVLVGTSATDFSDPSLPALRAAAAEARRRGASLHLVHVLDLDVYMMAGTPAGAGPHMESLSALALEGFDELRAAAETRLTEALQQLTTGGHTAVVTGHAGAAIAEYAETAAAELMVVGTHGRSGLARMTLGSTATGVVESAPCSVLVVRVAGV